jgi:hypothetical protein
MPDEKSGHRKDVCYETRGSVHLIEYYFFSMMQHLLILNKV